MAIGISLCAASETALIEVSISPESRVKAAEGNALRELVQGEWREFDIVINNAAGITSPLQIESENLTTHTPGRDQWLRLELIPRGPLSGKRSETRKLRLWTDSIGVRSAVINVNAGQGTQDLGFRSDVLLNFKISPTTTVQATDGWWPGALDLGCSPEDAPAVMRAKGLHIGQVHTWTNDENTWADRTLPADPVAETPDGRFYHILAGKDERGGGPLLMLGLKAPFPLAGYPEKTREWPPSVFFLEMAKRRGAWTDAGAADSSDFPFWLASGKLDSVGIGGGGRGSREFYFKALNCGLRLPPSTGADASCKMDVHMDGTLTWQGWWEGFKAGRVVVSNGPLLRVTANGKLPGEVMQTTQGPLQVLLAGNSDSQNAGLTVELIRNGRPEIIKLPALVTINESGWFAVRATAGAGPSLRFAMTAPWYVEIGGESMKPRKQDAEFFLEWTRRRMKEIRAAIPEPGKQKSAFATLAVAEAFWRDKVGSVQILTRVRGRILDAQTKAAMPARIYIQNADGAWFFPESDGGTAVRYEKRNFNNLLSSENHTTLSAHPWIAELPAGRYTVTIERGKEWKPLIREIDVGTTPLDLELPLERWVNMAAEGWFSGETHVHRAIAELANIQLAEDLNVAFPLSYWCTHGEETPFHFDKGMEAGKQASLIQVDDTHVIWPLNTEWEIFTMQGHDHTLGAILALGHRDLIAHGAPPFGEIAAAVKSQNALIDMDKPDWPWSPALPAAMDIHLYELSNNHVWRVPFALTKWFTPAPEWMLPGSAESGTERDWLEYIHRTYWAMLNCGKRLQPSAGTASGVHPVPLGYSRVYVNCPDGFSYENWCAGLRAGRSFVTTGPMLDCKVRRDGGDAVIDTRVRSQSGVGDVEIIVNGVIRETHSATGSDTTLTCRIPLDGTTWIAVRAWEPQPDGRFRFAHSAPVWFDDPLKPLRPLKREAEFLASRVRDEIARSRGVLPPTSLAEFQQALAEWERAAEHAR